MREEILRLDRVTCAEQGVSQLDGFSLNIFAGEIMGLVPLNNQGVSTLLRLLQQNAPLQGGYVYYRETQINTWHRNKLQFNRIGIIQSESCLVEGLTVADNIFVLKPGFKSPIIRPHILREQLFPFLSSLGIDISASAYVENLTVFQRVIVELLKAVVAGCKLVILRDIGAHISEPELLHLHEVLRHYARQGIAFLYIDFHVEEMLQLCDRISLMSDGKILKVLPRDEITAATFARYTKNYNKMVRQLVAHRSEEAWDKAPVFTVKNLSGVWVNNLSFSLEPGECLVLQDLDNQMFDELLTIMTGQSPHYSGQLLLNGEAYSPASGGELAVIQELPTTTMLFPELSYLDNLCFTLDRRLPELWRSASVQRGIQQELSRELGNDVFQQRVDSLSEIQKYDLVYTRIALQKPKVVFCVQPFRRADLELRMHIWELLKKLLDKDIALVILAVNLADSLSLADQLIRVKKGLPSQQYGREDFANISINAPWLNLYRTDESK